MGYIDKSPPSVLTRVVDKQWRPDDVNNSKL